MTADTLQNCRGHWRNAGPCTSIQNIDLWILIAGSVFVIPFLISFETADALLTPRFVALGAVSLGLFGSILFISLRLRIERPAAFFSDPLFIVMGLSQLVSLVALTQAVNLGEGIVQWLKGVLVVAFTYGAVWVLHCDWQRISRLIRSIIAAGTVFSLIGWIQWRIPGWLNLPGHFDVYGTMGNKNLYASALFLFMPFFMCGLVLCRGRWRLLSVLGLFLATAIIIVTRTRSVWLAILVSALASGMALAGEGSRSMPLTAVKKVWNRVRRPAIQRHRRRQAVAILFVVLLGWGGVWLATPAFTPSGTHHLLSTASIADRAFLWTRTMRMAADHPLTGIGPGQWKLRLPEYGFIDRQYASDGTAYEVVFTRPHNDFLWVLAETGLPGLICMSCFFGILVRRCIGLIHRAGNRRMKHVAACMLFGVVGFMVISFFSFPRERIFHNVFLALMAAVIVVAHGGVSTGGAEPAGTGVRWPLVVGIAVCTVCLLVGLSRYRSDRYCKQSLDAMNDGHPQTAVRLLEQARSGLFTLDPSAVPLAWYSGMMHYQSGRLHLATESFVAATQDHPFHLYSLNNAAVCLAQSNNGGVVDNYRRRADRIAAVRSRI